MKPLVYQPNGNLLPGIHPMSMDEFDKEFGYNSHRANLLSGMKRMIEILISCNCKIFYVDGSFVTKKSFPGDFDACFDPSGVNFAKLVNDYPVFFDRSPGRKLMKKEFGGEVFSSTAIAAPPSKIFLDFFQRDKDGNPKGIISLNLI